MQVVSEIMIQDLADQCYVSKTTVVRMCQKLEFDGFAEFRYFLKEQIVQKKSVKKLVKGKIYEQRFYDYTNTNQLINYEYLKKIVEVIDGKNIYFFGKGLSHLICEL